MQSPLASQYESPGQSSKVEQVPRFGMHVSYLHWNVGGQVFPPQEPEVPPLPPSAPPEPPLPLPAPPAPAVPPDAVGPDELDEGSSPEHPPA